jgi:hypothetical protein
MIYFALARYLANEVTMFDNLRDSAFYEEEQDDLYKETPAKPVAPPRRRRHGRFLGMTASQRFVVSMMLFFTVCLIGTLALLMLEKMSLF